MTLKKILVATDFGEAADAALEYARALARQFGAELHVLHAARNIYLETFGAETFTAIAPTLQNELEEAAKRQLDERLVDSDRSDPRTLRVVMTSSSPAYTIVEYAKDKGVDLIVMGTHGRGALAHMMMGSVAERVVRMATCPVLTVKHPEHEFVVPDTLVAIATA
jgi:nucleotide-binding universal stress UspA family protein